MKGPCNLSQAAGLSQSAACRASCWSRQLLAAGTVWAYSAFTKLFKSTSILHLKQNKLPLVKVFFVSPVFFVIIIILF